MAADSETDEGMPAQRTVTAPSRDHPNAEMSFFGFLMFGIMLVMLVPLLPVILLAWLLSWLLGD